MSKKGNFIVIEGIDGSGKSTAAARVVEQLRSEDIPVVRTQEPTPGLIGKLIRQYLSTEYNVLDEYAIQMLYMADRLEHLADSMNGINQFIDKGVNVVCDRFMFSSVAYGCYEEMLDLMNKAAKDKIKTSEFISKSCQLVLNELAMHENSLRKHTELLTNMHTIYLDIDPQVCEARINARNNKNVELFEDRHKLDVFSCAYDMIQQVVKAKKTNVPYQIISVNANRPEDEVALNICRHIKLIIEE